MSFESDLSLERRFARMIKAILGLHFFNQDEFSDKHEATDFGIFSSEPIRCAVRLRRWHHFEGFGGQRRQDVTIRWWRPSGVRTEIDKVELGLVNHMLYGFVDHAEQKIAAYSILKLPQPFGLRPYRIFPNNPPDSKGAVFRLRDFEVLKQYGL
jgi:hypothetical protein